KTGALMRGPAPAVVVAVVGAGAGAGAVDVDVDVDVSSLKASRASQDGGAVERPMSERSEFGPRAPPAEKRRAPARRSRDGSRRRRGFWFLLARQKELAREAGESFAPALVLASGLLPESQGRKSEARASALSRGLLLSWQK